MGWFGFGLDLGQDLLSDGDGHGGGADLLAVVCGDGGGEGGGDEGELHFDGWCCLFVWSEQGD